MLEPQIVVGDFAQQVCWAVCRETIRNMSLGFQVFNFRCCDVIWVFSLSRFLAFFNHSWKDGVWKCEHESEKFGRNITSEILRSVPGPISPWTAANPGKSTIWRNKRCPQIPLMHNLSFFSGPPTVLTFFAIYNTVAIKHCCWYWNNCQERPRSVP